MGSIRRSPRVAALVTAAALGFACASESPATQPRVEPPAKLAADECRATCTAQQERCEGWARVEFDIPMSGKPTNVRLVESCPPGELGEVAVRIVSDWTFPPEESNREGVEIQLDFAPEEGSAPAE